MNSQTFSGEETIDDVLKTLTPEQLETVSGIVGIALSGDTPDIGDEERQAAAKVFDTLTDKQKTVVYVIVGMALSEEAKEENQNEESDNG